MYVTCQIALPSLKVLQDRVDLLKGNVDAAMSSLGDEVVDYMSTYIRKNTQRHPETGTLADSIKKHVFIQKNISAIGIAKTSEMPPYWRFVNNGGMPPPSYGFFSETGAPQRGTDGTERFINTAGYKEGTAYWINPQVAYGGMHYIEKTKEYFASKWADKIKSRLPRR